MSNPNPKVHAIIHGKIAYNYSASNYNLPLMCSSNEQVAHINVTFI